MDTFMAIIAVLLGLVGILGSILPVLPGPPLGWVGMLLIYFRGGTDASGDPMSPAVLFIWLGITLAVTLRIGEERIGAKTKGVTATRFHTGSRVSSSMARSAMGVCSTG